MLKEIPRALRAKLIFKAAGDCKIYIVLKKSFMKTGSVKDKDSRIKEQQ